MRISTVISIVSLIISLIGSFLVPYSLNHATITVSDFDVVPEGDNFRLKYKIMNTGNLPAKNINFEVSFIPFPTTDNKNNLDFIWWSDKIVGDILPNTALGIGRSNLSKEHVGKNVALFFDISFEDIFLKIHRKKDVRLRLNYVIGGKEVFYLVGKDYQDNNLEARFKKLHEQK